MATTPPCCQALANRLAYTNSTLVKMLPVFQREWQKERLRRVAEVQDWPAVASEILSSPEGQAVGEGLGPSQWTENSMSSLQ